LENVHIGIGVITELFKKLFILVIVYQLHKTLQNVYMKLWWHVGMQKGI